MESEWLKERREAHLATTLGHPRLDQGARNTLVALDRAWERRQLTLATRAAYATQGRRLAEWLGKPFKEATRADVEAYLDEGAKTLAPNTMAARKRFLKVFFKALLAPDDIGHPPIVSWIREPKASHLRKLPQNLLSPDEVRRIAGAACTARDRAMMMVLYESAARASEIVSLRVGDVEVDAYGARIALRGKTGMRKVRLIDSVPDLTEWLNFHPTASNMDAPLFVSWGHQNRLKPIMADGLASVISAAVQAAGITKRVHPHLFRHSRLTQLAKQLSESELKVFAGWTGDSNMAKTYIHLSGEDIDRKLLLHAGLLKSEEGAKEDPLAPRPCRKCGARNSASTRYCQTCKLPTDEKEASQWVAAQDTLAENAESILNLLKDPRIKALLASPPAVGAAAEPQ